jgi:hypothetical protein
MIIGYIGFSKASVLRDLECSLAYAYNQANCEHIGSSSEDILMSQSRGNRGKRTSNYEFIYIYDVQPFDVDEYVQNPAMIRKLHAEMRGAHSVLMELCGQLEPSQSDFHQMEMQKRELELKLHGADDMIVKLQDGKEAVSREIQNVNMQLESMIQQRHDLEPQKRELELNLIHTQQKLSEASQTSLTKFATSTAAAAIVLGFGAWAYSATKVLRYRVSSRNSRIG